MSTIGRYRIEAEIGRGAMGVVYRATDPELHRPVALKTYSLPEGLGPAQRDEFRRRFRREAQAAAALSHPGIVTVFDAGEDPGSGLPFIAMEYVPGRSLADLLRTEGAIPLERVRSMASTLAGALSSAHAAGIVHRDVKPANILVDERDGSVKIADFGVARVQTSTLTRSGASMGSPAYMSPEQIRGKDVDGRSDFFSLAVILYESLCGVRPFEGKEIAEVVYAVAHETPVPMSRRNPNLPPSLDAFFDRALAKQASDRFADGGELLREFERAATEVPSSAADVDATVRELPPVPAAFHPGPSRRPRSRPIWIAAAAVVALAGSWILFGEEDAQLMLDGKSRVDGNLVLLVDGEEVYERTLAAPARPEGRERGFFRKVSESLAGPDYESFETLLDVEPGTREIEVVITPRAGEPYRSAVVAELEPGRTHRLKLVAGRSLGSSLSLRLD